MIRYRISFIGAGRVARALCLEMYNSGFEIQTIVSKDKNKSSSFVKACGAEWSNDMRFSESTDILIVSVPDDELKNVLESINCSEITIVAHTAGSIGLDVFPASLKHTGVFYPLQTFSFDRKIDFNGLPFFIEASDPYVSATLDNIARTLGGVTYFIGTEQRQMLHLAAVFANNFTNYMLTAGKQITLRAGVQFDVLEPLLRETVSKACENGPENSQTGPAVRFDSGTIEKHIDLLSFSPELQHVYKEITESIIKYYKSCK